MIARWMLASLAFTALCGLAAWAADRLVQSRGRPTRLVWAFALAVGTTWPLFAPFVLPPAPAPASLLAGAPPTMASADDLTALPDASVGWMTYAEPLIIAAWALGTLILLAQLTVALRALARIRRTASRVHLDGEHVLVDDTLGPAVIGLVTPLIVVPAWLLELDPSLRTLVLRHEREHCRAQDPRLVWLGVIATTLLPWNAPLWWISRRLRLAMELDCDARTLAGADDRARYAKLLLLIAQRSSSARFVPMLLGTSSQLARRIAAMHRTPDRHPALRATVAGAVALAAVTAACSSRIASNLTSPAASVSAEPVTVGEPLTSEKPMRDFTVDTMAHLTMDSPLPTYPASLRGSGRIGFVITQLIVNADGSAEAASLRVVNGATTERAFVDAVRAAIPQLRFEPAIVKGRAVRQLVVLPFNFDETGTTTSGVRTLPPAPPAAPASTSSDGRIYFDFQVERPVFMAPGSSGPLYPTVLREKKVEGAVLAQFVVGTDGRAEMNSFKVLRTSEAAFSDAVRDAVATMQFTPALVGGKAVRQLVQQPFQFALNR